MQGQTGPLSLHPRSTVGTTASRRRELRNARAPVTWAASGASLLLSAVLSCSERKKDFYKHTAYELTSKRSGPRQCQVALGKLTWRHREELTLRSD